MPVMTAEKFRELGLQVPEELDVHAVLEDVEKVVHCVVVQVEAPRIPHPGRAEMASFVPNDGNRHQI